MSSVAPRSRRVDLSTITLSLSRRAGLNFSLTYLALSPRRDFTYRQPNGPSLARRNLRREADLVGQCCILQIRVGLSVIQDAIDKVIDQVLEGVM
jgi:hypothetical protein